MSSVSPQFVPIPSYFFYYGGGPNDVDDKGEKESKVYSRRTKQQEKDKPPSQTPGQEASLDPSPESGIGPPSSVSPSIPLLDDSNILIAIRKGVRSCTQHPISNFVSLNHLSQSFHSLSAILSSESIPRSVLEALSQPH